MIIYKATNIVNNKVYIGQTIVSFNERVYEHTRRALKNKDSIYFHRAIKKYGKNNFIFEEIDKCESFDELNYFEKYWIKFYRSNNKKYGYNLTSGGRSNFFVSESTREKIRQNTKLQKPYWLGKKRDRPTIEKMRLANIGRLSPMKGKKIPEWHRQKLIRIKNPIICIETGEVFDTPYNAFKVHGFGIYNIIAEKPRQKTLRGNHWRLIETFPDES